MAAVKHTAPKASTAKPARTKRQADAVIAEAIKILESRLRRPGTAITSPDTARAYLRLNLSHYEHEVFAVMFLDNKHRVLAFDEMFHGTIDGANVYAREVVKAALQYNAAAVILAHNHPSGVADPSRADIAITARLRDALSLIDVRLLDHCIVGSQDVVSMTEREQQADILAAAAAIQRAKSKRAPKKQAQPKRPPAKQRSTQAAARRTI